MKSHEARDLITRLVERTTGFRVQVARDPSLETLGTVRMARASSPYHLIRYNSSAEDILDYVVSFECGFVLRQVGVPPEKRYEVGPSTKGKREVARLVQSTFGPNNSITLPETAQSTLSAQLLGGLITQLRSIPLALRIDHWLLKEYSGLRDQQNTACLRQLQDGIAVLDPRVRRSMPTQIAEASVAMNAAQALYWVDVWGDEHAAVPYKAAGLLSEGASLLRLWEEIPSSAIHDRELIDAWGKHLGIADWYEFVPYDGGAG